MKTEVLWAMSKANLETSRVLRVCAYEDWRLMVHLQGLLKNSLLSE